MGKTESKELWTPVEWLDFHANNYIYKVEDKLDLYNISVQIDRRQVEEVFNKVIKIEEKEEQGVVENTRGRINVRRDGSGKYYSIKNISIHFCDFLEFAFSMVKDELDNKGLACAILLLKLIEQIGVELDEEQITVCVALYQATKQYIVTDDNVIGYILTELKNWDDMDFCEQEVEELLEELIDMEIVSIEEGRYEVKQKVVFEYE